MSKENIQRLKEVVFEIKGMIDTASTVFGYDVYWWLLDHPDEADKTGDFYAYRTSFGGHKGGHKLPEISHRHSDVHVRLLSLVEQVLGYKDARQLSLIDLDGLYKEHVQGVQLTEFSFKIIKLNKSDGDQIHFRNSYFLSIEFDAKLAIDLLISFERNLPDIAREVSVKVLPLKQAA